MSIPIEVHLCACADARLFQFKQHSDQWINFIE